MTGLFVVTGASSGIGRALALRLAAPGVTLVLVARRCAELDATAAAVVARGGTPHVQRVDLSDPDAARAAALDCLDAWGVPDAVFANAGLSIRRSVLDKVTLRSHTGVICVEMMCSFQRVGARFVQVGVSHYARPHGKSQFFRLPAIGRSAVQLLQLWWRLMIRREH